MFKRVLAALLCLSICFAVGCSKNTDRLSVDMGDEVSVPEEPVYDSGYGVNPLTGVADLTQGKENDRPVAITINNIKVAQTVQTGIGKADVVYETEVEGGVTRLVALYQDVSKVSKIGTVRSARYPFIDLAMGHNAIYVHHGLDYYHAGPHIDDVDRLVLDTNNAGERVNNGLASEHTLYAHGDKLWTAISNKFNTKNTSSEPWLNFVDEDERVDFDNTANSVKIPFSTSYASVFKYDETSKSYTRYFNNDLRKDYVTGETVNFKNVFLLTTSIYTYPNCNDGYRHQKVDLVSGSGYYFVNGTYSIISWRKGNSSNGFVFTGADGNELAVQPGNSWICIADKEIAYPVIE